MTGKPDMDSSQPEEALAPVAAPAPPLPVYRPSSWAILHLVNSLTRFLAGRLGLESDGVPLLEVKGRKSGAWHSTPVRLLEVEKQRYLVALQGKPSGFATSGRRAVGG